MKLYTEEDIAKAITFGWELSHYHRNSTEDELLEKQKNYITSLSLTATELPSDEEIEEMIANYGVTNTSQIEATRFTAKWMRDKIKGDKK